MRLLGALFICILTVLAAEARNDFTGDGPYEAHSQLFKGVKMPNSTGCKSCEIDVRLTWPKDSDTGDSLQAPPFPLVLMMNGWQMNMKHYERYVNHLVSYGYVAIQYQTQSFSTPISTEQKYFKHIIEWANDRNSDPKGPVYKRIDFERIGVAGHSRGGHLAALHLADEDVVKTGYLIDPVGDSSSLADEDEDEVFPSAVKALQGKNLTAGLVGAGIIWWCNPDDVFGLLGNYKEVWKALGHGSWKTIVRKTGHTQFADLLDGWGEGLDRTCGCAGREGFLGLWCPDRIDRTKPGMVAWFENAFRESTNHNEILQCGKGEVNGFLEDHCEWVKENQSKNKIEFTVKDTSAETCDWEGCDE